MIIERGYKVELDPTNKQRSPLVQHAGAARFTYNWGLAEWKRLYEAGEAGRGSVLPVVKDVLALRLVSALDDHLKDSRLLHES